MNRGRAMEMVCFNKMITADEAEKIGLVTRVFSRSSFETETPKLIRSYAKLPMGSLNAAKNLIRKTEMDQLHRANKSEVQELKIRWRSEECMEAVLNFFQNRSKL